MLNSPFVMEVVRNMAGRIEFNGISNEGRVKKAYDILFQRAPTPIEIQLALQFISKPSVAAAPVWQYGYGGVEGQKVTNFTPLPHWSGAQWQGSAAFPDSKLSYLMLNKQGGHPGADLQHAAIRRWVSPIDGSVKIEGSLYHPEKQGDGVRGTIVSSRIGKIGEWNAHTGRTDTSVQDIEVKKGDTLDFVVDCRGSQDFDGFTWVPTIKQMQGSGAKTVALGRLLSWSAESDFGGRCPTELLTLGEVPSALDDDERILLRRVVDISGQSVFASHQAFTHSGVVRVGEGLAVLSSEQYEKSLLLFRQLDLLQNTLAEQWLQFNLEFSLC